MNAVIIDDQSDAREALKNMLAHYCPEIKVVGEADGVQKGLEMLSGSSADLLFLDVEMPDGTGIDLLKALEEIPFHLIFYTAYDRYAIDAIKLSAVDYLLKPVDGDDLREAVRRVKERERPWTSSNELKSLTDNMSVTESKDQKLILRDKDSIYILQLSEIIRVEGEGSYSTFFTEAGEGHIVSHNLKYYENILSERGFFRSHTSHLINLQHLRRVSRKEGDTLVMSDRSEVPLARRRKDALFKKLE